MEVEKVDSESDEDMDTKESSIKDLAIGWLIKLREMHYLSERAIAKVVELSKVLQVHYTSSVKDGIQSILKGNDCQSFCMQLVHDNIEAYITHPLEGYEPTYQQRAHIARNFPYVVSMTFLKIV